MNEAITSIFRDYWVYLVFWDLVWRGIALWRAGRTNQPTWFIALFLLNTLGILPLVFLFAVDKGVFIQSLKHQVAKLSKGIKNK